MLPSDTGIRPCALLLLQLRGYHVDGRNKSNTASYRESIVVRRRGESFINRGAAFAGERNAAPPRRRRVAPSLQEDHAAPWKVRVWPEGYTSPDRLRARENGIRAARKDYRLRFAEIEGLLPRRSLGKNRRRGAATAAGKGDKLLRGLMVLRDAVSLAFCWFCAGNI